MNVARHLDPHPDIWARNGRAWFLCSRLAAHPLDGCLAGHDLHPSYERICAVTSVLTPGSSGPSGAPRGSTPAPTHRAATVPAAIVPTAATVPTAAAVPTAAPSDLTPSSSGPAHPAPGASAPTTPPANPTSSSTDREVQALHRGRLGARRRRRNVLWALLLAGPNLVLLLVFVYRPLL